MSPWRRLRHIRTAFLLSLLPGLLGVALTRWAPAVSLEKAGGLDRLFALRGPRTPPPDVCVVAIDDDSYKVLERDPLLAWPRGLHADLIRALRREGARAVAFDVLFTDPGADTAQDTAFASALAEAGDVILGASVEITEDPLFRQARIEEPYETFAKAAAAVADVNVPTDSDGVIRFAWPAREGRPGLGLAAYELATGDTSQRTADARLLDYYGPARAIKTVSIYQALDAKHYLPPGFFKDKIVFVGKSMDAEAGLLSKDSFLTPFRGKDGSTTFGVEVHATLAANLVEHRQVKLLDRRLEIVLLLLLPLVIRFGSAYKILEAWTLSADLGFPKDNEPYLAIGNEYRWALGSGLSLAGRVGFNSATLRDDGGFGGLSFGVGLGMPRFGFDYGLLPFGSLGLTHRLSFSFKF